MSEPDSKGKRVDLGGSLAGYYVRVDVDALDCGVLEDLESAKIGRILAALAGLLVGGDLPHGHDLAGLRKLKPQQLGDLVGILPELIEIPKPR